MFVVLIFFLYLIVGFFVCVVFVNFDFVLLCFEFGVILEFLLYFKFLWEFLFDASSYVVVFLVTLLVVCIMFGRMVGLVGMLIGEVVVLLLFKIVVFVVGDGVSGVFDGVGVFDVGWVDDKDIDFDINFDVFGFLINDLRNVVFLVFDLFFVMFEICFEILEFVLGCVFALAVDVSSRVLLFFDGVLGDGNVSLYVCVGIEFNFLIKFFDVFLIEFKSEFFLVLILFAVLDEFRVSVFSSSLICLSGVDVFFVFKLFVVFDFVFKVCDCVWSLFKMDLILFVVSSSSNVFVFFFFEFLGSIEDNLGSLKLFFFVLYVSFFLLLLY